MTPSIPRKTPILAAILLGFTGLANGQVNRVWTRDLTAPSPTTISTANTLALESGGCYSVRNYAIPVSAGTETIVTRHDANGDVLWELTNPTGQRTQIGALYPQVDASENLVMHFPESPSYRLVKVAASGTIVYDKQIALAANEISINASAAFEIAPSGRVIVPERSRVMNTTVNDQQIRSFDAQGQQEWRTMLPTNSEFRLAPPVDERTVAAMVTSSNSQLIALNPDGTTAWLIDESVNGPVRSVDQNAAGQIATLRHVGFPRATWISCYDAQGQFQFSSDLGPFQSLENANMRLAQDGSIVYSEVQATMLGLGSPQVALGQLSPSGQVAWEIPMTAALAGIDVLDITSQGLIVCGNELGFGPGPAAFRGPLFAINSLGQPQWSLSQETQIQGTWFKSFSLDSQGNLYVLARTSPSLTTTPELLTRCRLGAAVSTALCSSLFPNSTGRPGRIEAFGTNTATENDVTLRVNDLPAGVFTLFIASDIAAATPTAPSVGAGLICLGGAIGRFTGPGQIRQVDLHGRASIQLDLNAIPGPSGPRPAFAGQTWHFQAWHRDNAFSSNLTGAVSIQLQ